MNLQERLVKEEVRLVYDDETTIALAALSSQKKREEKNPKKVHKWVYKEVKARLSIIIAIRKDTSLENVEKRKKTRSQKKKTSQKAAWIITASLFPQSTFTRQSI